MSYKVLFHKIAYFIPATLVWKRNYCSSYINEKSEPQRKKWSLEATWLGNNQPAIKNPDSQMQACKKDIKYLAQHPVIMGEVMRCSSSSPLPVSTPFTMWLFSSILSKIEEYLPPFDFGFNHVTLVSEKLAGVRWPEAWPCFHDWASAPLPRGEDAWVSTLDPWGGWEVCGAECPPPRWASLAKLNGPTVRWASLAQTS